MISQRAVAATYTSRHLSKAAEIIPRIDIETEKVAGLPADLRKCQGRLFFLGVGGSADNCSHPVNDSKDRESYVPTDNVSVLTARTNDEGWATFFVEWLKASHPSSNDKSISRNLVTALKHAKRIGAKVVGVVGRDGGYTAQVADACVSLSRPSIPRTVRRTTSHPKA